MILALEVTKALEELINNVDISLLPYKKGNSIRIGNLIIRKSSHSGYMVYDKQTNKRINSFCSKIGAVAFAKNFNKVSQGDLDKIEYLDHKIQKHHNDSLFYQNTINKTNDDDKIENAEIRLEIALAESEAARDGLLRYIF